MTKTLNEVGAESAKFVGESKALSDEMDESKSHHINTRGKFIEKKIEAQDFAKANAEQLHDLAVIEAHLGGVAISVEQPLEIGQKVEVHMPQSH